MPFVIPFSVIPAKAGIQAWQGFGSSWSVLDSRLRGNGGVGNDGEEEHGEWDGGRGNEGGEIA